MDADTTYRLLRHLASPVVVVTSAWEGIPNAMISNSALRASLTPAYPRVLVLISKRAFTHDLILHSKAFALHLLRTDQMELVWRFGFFSRREGEKLRPDEWEVRRTGSPILKDALAFFDCRVEATLDTGPSTLFLGHAVECAPLREGPLLTADYFRTHMPAPWRPLYEAHLREAQRFAEEYLRRLPTL
ncbi:MAG: flavin reductase family protein [Dehalococcoidia bacterium]|nr:flavin reductase family protein [Dehalococcoidia bacterium]MDW8119406.1 flavin reductase family protein [Chloroflexota bacterium]